MDPVLAFIVGMALVGFLWLGARAVSVWEKSVVPAPAADKSLDAVRIALSQFDPERVLGKLDELERKISAGVDEAKLVPVYDRMNLLSKDMMEAKAELVKLRAQSGARRLLGGAKNEAPADG